MIHPDTRVKNTPKGLGIFAGRKFFKGEIFWIADDIDEKLPLSEYMALDPIQQKKLNIYSYLDNRRRVIIPWDEGKYVNHSCDPNSTALIQYDNISIALRDIEKDEEIVEDYYSYFGHFESFTCKCGAPNCRGRVEQADSFRSALRLDMQDVSELILSVQQPLLEIHAKEIKEFIALLRKFASKRTSVAVPIR